MNRPELYHKTVSILVKAYLNDTLIPGKCYACAVGNLVCGNMGISQDDLLKIVYPLDRFQGWEESPKRGWPAVFITEFKGGKQKTRPGSYMGEAKRQIDSTGYTWEELAKIENAFESINKSLMNNDEIVYKGLMAVVEVLGEIHEASQEEVKSSKELFVKN